jgi:hypothetical protein
MIIVKKIVLCLTITLVSVPLTQAHHSVAGYEKTFMELEGELVGLKWRNPHVMFMLKTEGDAGGELWEMESESIFILEREGLSKDLFATGTKVTVSGRKSNKTKNKLLITNMLFDDGREVLLFGDAKPRYTQDAIINAEEKITINAAEENKGIYRVWSLPQGVFYFALLPKLPFTEQALAGRKDFDLTDNFATRCEPEGMPRIMVNPHSFEFINQGDDIILHTELYDIRRTIHMDVRTMPDDVTPSSLGYSIGHWEDNTLVVETRHINWPYFDNLGTRQTEDLRVLERFTLSEDQGRLDFHITLTDPATFYEPAVMQGHWLALGHTIPEYNCTIDE